MPNRDDPAAILEMDPPPYPPRKRRSHHKPRPPTWEQEVRRYLGETLERHGVEPTPAMLRDVLSLFGITPALKKPEPPKPETQIYDDSSACTIE